MQNSAFDKLDRWGKTLLCGLFVAASLSFSQQPPFRDEQQITRFLKRLPVDQTAKTRDPKGEIQRPGTVLALPIPFDFNSADLTPSAKQQLDELGRALLSLAGSPIGVRLAGHRRAITPALRFPHLDVVSRLFPT